MNEGEEDIKAFKVKNVVKGKKSWHLSIERILNGLVQKLLFNGYIPFLQKAEKENKGLVIQR